MFIIPPIQRNQVVKKDAGKIFRTLLKSMRPRQWIKNVFLFAAVVFDRQLSLSHPAPIFRSIAGAMIFCLFASTVYIINDLIDATADRMHPIKRERPIASGDLPIPIAIAVAISILVLSLPLAFLLSPPFALICVSYIFLNLLYSIWLKHVVIIDVLLLVGFYVLRVIGGVTLVHVARFSPWLYIVTTMGALYIGFGKRRAELNLLAGDATKHRKALADYTIPYLDQLIDIAAGATIVSYCLYTFSTPNLTDGHVMMLTIPFIIYGIFRYQYLVQVKNCGGIPEEVFLKDHPLQLDILFWSLAICWIFYFIGQS